MKRYIILSVLFLIPVLAMCQVQPKLGGIKADSISFKDDTWVKWVTGISDDTTLVNESQEKIVTEYAVKTYVDNAVPSGIESLQDSIDLHTDTLQSHNTRINTNLTSIESKQDSIDNHTDTLQSHNTRINANYALIEVKQDSIDVHTDTLQAHNSRINVLEAAGGGGDVSVSGTPAVTQIAVWTDASTVKGSSSFLFTDGTKTNWGIYTGTDNPDYSGRINWNVDLHTYSLSVVSDIVSGVLKSSSATSTAGYFDNGTTAPSAVTRLNYNGLLYVNDLIATRNIRSNVLNTYGTTSTSGGWDNGTTNPTGTTRLNYNGDLWATKFNSANFKTTSDGGLYIADSSRFMGAVVLGDSLDVSGEIHAQDSLVLEYLAGGDDLWWPVGKGTGAIDSGYLSPASFALEIRLQTAQQRLAGVQDGEIEWYYTIGGAISSTFIPNKLGPMQYLQALQAAIELNLRNIAEVEKKQAELEERISALEKRAGIKNKRKRK